MNIKSEIKSYKEKKFIQIMEIDGITPNDVATSLALLNNRKEIFAAGEGAGQSGSFFFFSNDNRFIIKTLRGSEK